MAMVLLAAAFYGYSYFRDKAVDKKAAEYRRFASVTAETSVAAELYRNYHDSFLVARDSILNKYAMTLEDIAAFRARISKNQPEWGKVWFLVDSINDSLVKAQFDRMKAAKDTTSDSLAKLPSK